MPKNKRHFFIFRDKNQLRRKIYYSEIKLILN
jgi:hypothetical protein